MCLLLDMTGFFIGKHFKPTFDDNGTAIGAFRGRILGDMLALIDGAEPKSLQELRNAELVRRMSDDGPARPSGANP